MPMYATLLVDVPASYLKAGATLPVKRIKPMVTFPELSILRRADTDFEVVVPTVGGYKLTTRVFVYGTLMRGFGNNVLLKSATYLGPALTRREFRMYSLGAFPAARWLDEGDATGVALKGEVYEVDMATLARLDQLEGVGRGFYDRTTHLLRSWMHRDPVFMYTMGSPRGELLRGGDWRAHQQRARQGAFPW